MAGYRCVKQFARNRTLPIHCASDCRTMQISMINSFRLGTDCRRPNRMTAPPAKIHKYMTNSYNNSFIVKLPFHCAFQSIKLGNHSVLKHLSIRHSFRMYENRIQAPDIFQRGILALFVMEEKKTRANEGANFPCSIIVLLTVNCISVSWKI